MNVFRPFIAALALSVAPAAVAQTAPDDTAPGSTIVRLTPEQVEAAKEAAAERNMKAASGIDNGVVNGRQVHGEMGIAIGTSGYRSIFGTAVMPLGQSGALALSFENTQGMFGRYGYRH